jgi:hypothetical protein
MLIALDYDGTYTADPGRWKEVIHLMRNAGHDFVCVTSRAGTPENKQLLGNSIGKLMPIIFCNHQPKQKKCLSLGYKIDVWIDDQPQTIPVAARVLKCHQIPSRMNDPVYFHCA